MCVVSNVGDHYRQWYPQQYPWVQPYIDMPATDTTVKKTVINFGVSQEEFDALKKDVLEMKEILKAAKFYDDKTGQPDCEIEEKMKVLRKIAEIVQIDLDEVLGKTKDVPGETEGDSKATASASQ